MTEESLKKVNAILKENADAISFIKDFILRFRFADFALNTQDDKNIGFLFSYKTVSKMADDYEDDANKIVKDYEKKVKKICSKDNIRTYCENDDMDGLKQQLDDAKKIAFEKIIHQYHNVQAYGYTSGKISDFMIYRNYFEFLTSDDFYYDENNPYIVDLFNALSDFIDTRYLLESNIQNIDGLITAFNTSCISVLGQYWEPFFRDFYGKITTDLGESIHIFGDDSVNGTISVYNKTLDYLKAFTKYQEPTGGDNRYEGLTDDEIAKGSSKKDEIDKAWEKMESDSAEALKKLKRIAIEFSLLKRIENRVGNFAHFPEYVSDEDMTNIFTLKKKLDKTKLKIEEYSANTTDSKLLKYADTLKKYLGALRDLTETESLKLREISDRAIEWYLNKTPLIDSGEIFDQFKEANWTSPSTVYKDNEAHDFFFVTPPKTKKEEDEEAKKPDNYIYSDNSLKTKHNVDKLAYWKKYCTQATIANCMLPSCWATGVIISGKAIKLPIIFIPLFVVPGKVEIVIGMGVCGICPLPMVLFVNLCDFPMFVLPNINNLVDNLRALSGKIMAATSKPIKNIVRTEIRMYDDQINKINDEIKELDKKILNLSSGVKADMETYRNMRKRAGKIATTKRKGRV